ncbi:MAG: hypothetical protein U0531_08200 [Dehalococcoidia bacterium]
MAALPSVGVARGPDLAGAPLHPGAGRTCRPGRRKGSALAYGEQRQPEVARALAGDPRLLLLDEPAAGLPFSEVSGLADLVRSLAGEGRTVLLVEHNIELVMNVCDRITVLDFGRVIARTPAEISRHPDVLAAYLGTEA